MRFIPGPECLLILAKTAFLDFEVAFLYVLWGIGTGLKSWMQQVFSRDFEWII